jgi:hypothetical protein
VLINFEVDGTPYQYIRDPDTWKCSLKVGGEEVPLKVRWTLRELMSPNKLRPVEAHVAGHTIRITRGRALVLPEYMPQHFRIYVDGFLVAEETGK